MKEKPVTFKSKGEQIVGMLHLNRKKSPIVILLNGWAGESTGGPQFTFVRTARSLCTKGFSVLRFDSRGCGNSEGLFKDYSHASRLEDLHASINYLKRKLNSKRRKIGLLGWSMGGTTAIVEAEKNNTDVGCIVNWATPASYRDLWKPSDLKKAKKDGKFYIANCALWDSWRDIRDDLNHQVDDIIREVHIPALFIHGTKDKTVPINHAVRLYKNSGGVKKLVIINGAGHGFFGEQEKKELIKESISWFKKYLK